MEDNELQDVSLIILFIKKLQHLNIEKKSEIIELILTGLNNNDVAKL